MFLGVTLDHAMLWDKHIDTVASKLCRNIYLLRYLASSLSQTALISAYYSLVNSHLSYTILSWGHSPGSSRLFRLQRRAVRILEGLGDRKSVV